MKIVAVTACPTGIAHTYMAAEQLTVTAKKLGIDIKVETQGAMGVENEITEEDLKEAKWVILAADIAIQDRERFKDINVIESSVQEAIKDPMRLFKKIQ
ncbi:MAG: PTS fructose transporter subunit IIB [Oligoflexia bacterium]|nr:PTS fructose transporter subunit IIB [Oligoflexia bacterium]